MKLVIRSVVLSVVLLSSPVMVFAEEEFDPNLATMESVDVPEGEDPNAEGYSPTFETGAAPSIKAEKPVPVAAPESKPVPEPVAVKAKPPAPREIPVIETQNESSSHPDVTFVTGGIGDEERQAIEASKGDYNLHITNASVDGAFVGDVRVLITRKNGDLTEEMLNAVAGPMLNVRLPSGTYRLTATLGQQTKNQVFAVTKKGKPAIVQLGWK